MSDATILPSMIPIGKAARRLNVSKVTLQKWLESDFGLVFPRLGRGKQVLVDEGMVLASVKKRSPYQKYLPKVRLERTA
jgi:hypothetical protein